MKGACFAYNDYRYTVIKGSLWSYQLRLAECIIMC